MKNLSIRLRLTILSVLLLGICCVGLTVVLNVSANQMAEVIGAAAVLPSEAFGVTQAVETVEASRMQATITSQAAQNSFVNQSILYMLLVVIVGGVFTYYISGKALRPLQVLSRQMKKRTVHNLSENIPVPQSGDEIADLTIAFNEMSQKLDEAFAMQKRFSQSAAHELRTPLTVLKTKVDVFHKKQEHTPEEYHNLLSVISSHTDRLSELVKDLLELTNMEDLACEEKIELKELVEEVCGELNVLALERDITISAEGEKRAVAGNWNLLHRAFYNLVENAIKYNKKSGRVTITVIDMGEKVGISFADTGIGIPKDMQEQVFEPFFRVDKSRSRQMGGAGLGLTTVKSIIEKHSGSIAVSENARGDTVFLVILESVTDTL